MRRRGARSNTSSLFAFQDVMASLIGVLFFIVLFMALDIVEQSVPAAEAAAAAAEQNQALTALEEKLRQLEDERDRLNKQVARMTEKLNAASSLSDHDLMESIKKLHKQVQYLHAMVQQAESELAGKDLQVKKAAGKAAAARAEARKLDEQIRKLKATAKAARSMPRVAYIIDEAPNLVPWLVEVSRDRIRVAAKDGTSSVMSFAANSSDARKRQFLAWVKSQESSECYFVILIKPSGLKQAEEIMKELGKTGFRLGKDLLPEQWEPFEKE